MRTLLKASIPEAAYDSSARDSPPRCFPGTRRQYIQDITHWALASSHDTPLPVFWMRGPAGVGRSAVAQTCAEIVKEAGKLGATFFFSALNRRDDPKRFFTTLAYQISTIFLPYREVLGEKIRDDETLVLKSLARQFEELIALPFQELASNGKRLDERVIFIDGLDECMGAEAQCEIIETVVTSVRHRSAPFRWAFFSRPEPHIQAAFARNDAASLCLQKTLPVSRQADGEIETYLRSGFQDILRHHNLSIPHRWPSEEDLHILVAAAAGLFIYAASVLRFVGRDESSGPEEQLQAVLAAISNSRWSILWHHVCNTLRRPGCVLHSYYATHPG